MADENDNINILKHELVPKHEILPEEERKKLFEKFNITEKQLPKIKLIDPIIKEIGAKKGDVVRITRNSSVAGEIFYYRLVIKGARENTKW